MIKKLFSAFFITGCLLASSVRAEADIPEPYRSINDLPFDPHGWFGNAEQLTACFKEKSISTVIEVGS